MDKYKRISNPMKHVHAKDVHRKVYYNLMRLLLHRSISNMRMPLISLKLVVRRLLSNIKNWNGYKKVVEYIF